MGGEERNEIKKDRARGMDGLMKRPIDIDIVPTLFGLGLSSDNSADKTTGTLQNDRSIGGVGFDHRG